MSNQQVFLGGVLCAITLVIFAMGLYALAKLKTPGVRAFGYLCIVSSLYVAGYAMEIMSGTFAGIDFWSKFQYIFMPFIPAIWVTLSIEYCNLRKKYPRVFFSYLVLVPIISSILRLTSDWQPWYYRNMELVSYGQYQVLHFDRGPWYYVQIIYSILCILYALKNYFEFGEKVVALMRRQAIVMMVASIMPLIAILINTFEAKPSGIDVGPFALLFDFSLFMYGMYYYNMLSLVPLAREKVFDWIHDGVLVFDMNLRLIDMNMSAKTLFPRLMNLRFGLELKEIFEDQKELVDQISDWSHDISTATQNLQLEMKETLLDSTVRYFQLKLTKLFEGSIQIGTTLIIIDITSTQLLLDQLVQLTRLDSMTGLMNRRYFFERIEYEVERANRNKSIFSFIFFDLDNFKNINDQHGHAAGDDMIVRVAEICQKDLRSIDLFTRFGGDEFIIYLPDCDKKNAYEVAQRIRSSIESETMEYRGNRINASASFGVASYDVSMQGACRDVNLILRFADEAMYIAKRNGKNLVQIDALPLEGESLFNWQSETKDDSSDLEGR